MDNVFLDNVFFRELCPEWIKLRKCLLVLVSVSVEDERLLSAYNFVRNELRKALSTNLESRRVCVREKTQITFNLADFSFHLALDIFKEQEQERYAMERIRK